MPSSSRSVASPLIGNPPKAQKKAALPPAPKKTTAAASDAAAAAAAKSPAAGGIKMPPTTLTSTAARPTSLEGLLNAKQVMLASVEARFNEKILIRHHELMAEQMKMRSLESDGPRAEDHAKELKALREEMDEHKFSHEVELAFEKDKCKKLEKQLEEEKRRKEVAERSLAVANAKLDDAKKLEEDLQREKSLRMEQLKSLELLHFAELREIEKKHTEFVSHLVSTYQNEINNLKRDIAMKMSKEEETSYQQSESREDSHEAAEAAAALSSMATPTSTLDANDYTATIHDGTSDTEDPVTPTQMPLLPSDASYGEAKPSEVPVPSFPPLKRDISEAEVSDTGSCEEDSKGRSKRPRVTKSKLNEKQQILKKSGKSSRAKNVPAKKKYSSDPQGKKILSEDVKGVLRAWMMHPDNCEHPYPNADQKAKLMSETGLTYTELGNWFVNNRKRYWQTEVKPRIAAIKQAHRMKQIREAAVRRNAP